MKQLTASTATFITLRVLIKPFYKSQFPHKSVNLFFIITDTKQKLMDLCGNSLLQKDCMNTS